MMSCFSVGRRGRLSLKSAGAISLAYAGLVLGGCSADVTRFDSASFNLNDPPETASAAPIPSEPVRSAYNDPVRRSDAAWAVRGRCLVGRGRSASRHERAGPAAAFLRAPVLRSPGLHAASRFCSVVSGAIIPGAAVRTGTSRASPVLSPAGGIAANAAGQRRGDRSAARRHAL